MNVLCGKVLAVAATGGLAFVEVEVLGATLSATIVGALPAALVAGAAVRLHFKPMEVALGKGLSGGLTIRNRLPCCIAAIERGVVLSRVRLACRAAGPTLLEAIVTTRAADALALAPGDDVEALIKTNEMTLALAEAPP